MENLKKLILEEKNKAYFEGQIDLLKGLEKAFYESRKLKGEDLSNYEIIQSITHIRQCIEIKMSLEFKEQSDD